MPMPRDEVAAKLKQMTMEARTEGIIAGLEIAERFMALTADRKELAAMIRVAKRNRRRQTIGNASTPAQSKGSSRSCPKGLKE